MKVKDGAITLDATFKTLVGILSRRVLFNTFKFFSVRATFSIGILENRKTGVWSRLLLRFVLKRTLFILIHIVCFENCRYLSSNQITRLPKRVFNELTSLSVLWVFITTALLQLFDRMLYITIKKKEKKNFQKYLPVFWIL